MNNKILLTGIAASMVLAGCNIQINPVDQNGQVTPTVTPSITPTTTLTTTITPTTTATITPTVTPHISNTPVPQVIGYYDPWNIEPEQVQYQYLTDINYSFALPHDTAGLIFANGEDDQELRKLVDLAKANNVEVHLAVGGWIADANGNADDSVWMRVTIEQKRAWFIQTILDWAATYQVDGIDIDWEWPDNPEETARYELFMQQLKVALHAQNLELSTALGGSAWTGQHISDAALAAVDVLNVMSYDMAAGDHAPYSFAESSIDYWVNQRGFPAEKLALGIPFYARCCGNWGKVKTYQELLPKLINPFESNISIAGEQWYFNGINEVQRKTQLANDKGLHGTMIWALGQDAAGEYSLLKAIGDANRYGVQPTPYPTPTNVITPTPTPVTGFTGEWFDDFNYGINGGHPTEQNGWHISNRGGGPGPGTFKTSQITFAEEAGDTVMHMDASVVNGQLYKAEISSTEQKFLQGTYAARVKFSDMTLQGIDNNADKLVQTFFTITPLAAPMDPDYGEIDFEYLPKGGWGTKGSTMFMTTWETYNPNPWQKVGKTDTLTGSLDGWHTLVFTVDNGLVTYYMDGQLVAQHGDIYYPETPMYIAFNHWFISGDTSDMNERHYRQSVDWMYFNGTDIYTPAQVEQRVAELEAPRQR